MKFTRTHTIKVASLVARAFVCLFMLKEPLFAQGAGESLDIASVNGVTIRAAELSAIRTADQDQQKLTDEDVLKQLITEEALAQRAIDRKVIDEGDLATLSLVNKRAVLAQEYIRQVASKVNVEVKVDDPRIQSIIKDFPDRYGKRKLIIFEEASKLNADVSFWEALKNSSTKAELIRDFNEIGAVLEFETKAVYTFQMSALLRKALGNADAGDIVVLKRNGSDDGNIFIKVDEYETPLSPESAKAAARQELIRSLTNQAVEAAISDAILQSEIVYFGEFKNGADALPRGKSEQAVQQQKRLKWFFVLACAVMTFLGFNAYTAARRRWIGYLDVPFSRHFSEEQRLRIDKFREEDTDLTFKRQVSGIGKLVIIAVFPVLGAVFCSALLFAYTASGAYALVAAIVTLAVSPWLTQMAYTPSLRALTRKFPSRTLGLLVITWTMSLAATIFAHYKFAV